MAVSTITCPKCATVLRPAKPLPEGKKVKCPKCGTVFAAAEPAAGPAAKKPEPTGAKKNPPKGPALPRPGKDEDEEDSGGIYSFVNDGTADEEDEEDGKRKKPNINYAPDMSIKDLRGPAQEAVMRPSNALIFVGIMGFLGWLGLIVVLLIPVLFPLPDDDEGKPRPAKGIGPGLAAGAQGTPASPFGGPPPQSGDKEKKKDEEGKSAFDVAGMDFGLLAFFAWWLLILAILPLVLGMVYCGVVTYGGVKMQNLESRAWGIASSILALLPFTTGGLMLLTAFLCNWLLNMLFDDPAFSMYIAIVLMSIQTVAALAAGVWNLVVLMRPEVIEGFEYVPEYGTMGEPA
jgi:predicted Zn finger-like uncharacterized protein